MQPFLCSAAKDTSTTHTAAAPSNLDAAATMRFADSALHNTIQLHTAAPNIQLQNRISTPKPKNARF